MSENISIKKGLDVKLQGEADKVTKEASKSKEFALQMSDFHGITPKLAVKQGDKVLAGQTVFYSKSNEAIKFVSPVSGEIKEVVRGEKRRILSIVITAEDSISYQEAKTLKVSDASAEELKSFLLENGAFAFIKQRPYDVVANPEEAPRDIYISAYDSKPLAPDFDYTLKGKEEEIQAAVSALAKLTSGKVHVSLSKYSTVSPFNSINNITKHSLQGPHPVGNVSVQINKTNPLNKGEVVWTVNPSDLVIIGELLLTGKFNAERTIALTGSQINNPHYVKTIVGTQLKDIVGTELKEGENRIIDGNILTGTKSSLEAPLGYYSTQVTAIEEGADYDLFGWNRPRPNKFSFYKAAMFSFLTPNKKYALNANTNGEHRAFVLTGKYEKVFPLDIYPMQLLKSCMYEDLDEMEQLGIYEVAPEDFALTEFICPSKMNHQEIIRQGLDFMQKELA